MPHDKYGKRINIGDFVKVKPLNGKGGSVIGRVVSMTESQVCTGQVMWPAIGENARDYFNASDAEIVVYGDGSEPELIPGEQVGASQAR